MADNCRVKDCDSVEIGKLGLCKKHEEEMLESHRKIQELNKSGYAGVLANGKIVDRREHPEAVPVPANKMFGIAEPKEV